MKSAQLFKIIAVLILLFNYFNSTGQTNPYFHYSLPEGLPSSEVYDVFQDRKGFIWFATDNGVVRYDGKSMELFQTSEGLSDPVVFEFKEDASQRLWFRTFSGRISYFFNEKIYPYKFNDTLNAYCKSSFLESLYIDTTGQVWFGSAFDLGKIDLNGNLAFKIHNDSSYQVSFKSIENQIVSSHQGLKAFKAKFNGKYVRSHWADTLFHRAIIRTVKWRGRDYFSWGNALYKLDKNLVSPVIHGRGQIIALSIDKKDNLWIGYMHDGAESYSDFGKKNIDYANFTQSKSVTKILQDHQGGYWFSTLEDGVYYVPQDEFLVNNLSSGLRINKVTSWDNQIIVGDINGKLLVLNKKGEMVLKKQLGGNIGALLVSATNRLWVSASDKTYLYDKHYHEEKSIFRSFSSLHESKDGTIWGATGPKRLKYNQEGEFISYVDSNKANRLIYTNEQFIFLFGRLGVQVFNHKNKEIKLPPFFEALKVTKISPLNDSLLLFGTLGNGFLIVNQNQWSHEQYSSKNKFVASNVYDVITEGSDIWMGTEKGIAIASKESIIRRSPDFSFFITKNEMGNNKIDHLTSTSENIIAFSEGYFYTLPKKMHSSDLPLFHVQSLLVNNQPDSLKADRQLAFDENNIQINFRFIDFRNQNMLVRSRLSPQSHWNYSSDRNIKFYSLSSGSYNLELEYSIDNVHWHKATRWDFTILPPWWKTWHIQIAFILTLASWAIIYFKRRVARVNERNKYLNLINTQQQRLIRAELETLEAERNRIAKDLHDSVGTNLTAIKMTVWTILKKFDAHKAKAVENEFQNTIRDIKGIIHDLVPAGLDKYGLSETVRAHAAKIEESLDIKIEVNSFGPDIKDAKLNLLSFRILQELLANTLKHSGASKVVIHINSFEDLLSILYQDNGTGFDVESVEKGSGLYNIQSRVQTANGAIKFESSNFGVSYTIDIPLNHNDHDQNNISR